jgi:GNAT superfamily N-acetyltransferase
MLDFSQTDKPRQIQANLIAYMRLFAGLPGTTMRDDEVFWFVSNRPAPGNGIYRAAWTRDRSDVEIDSLFAEISRHIDEIDWMVFPSDQPADLNGRLEARGMPSGRGGYWLWADLTTLGVGPSVPADFRIERVRDDRQMAEWVRVSEAGFEEELGCFYDAYARHGYGPEAASLHYIGYLRDQAVTSATLLDAGDTASIFDVSTPPPLRQQGFGGAITHALMRSIRDRGYADTWIWSSEMAQSVYEALGYVPADFGLREHKWQRAPG